MPQCFFFLLKKKGKEGGKEKNPNGYNKFEELIEEKKKLIWNTQWPPTCNAQQHSLDTTLPNQY